MGFFLNLFIQSVQFSTFKCKTNSAIWALLRPLFKIKYQNVFMAHQDDHFGK